MLLEKTNYSGDMYIGDIGETNALNSIIEDYSSRVYLCDAILEESQNWGSRIETDTQLHNLQYIEDVIGEVLSEGLFDTRNFYLSNFLDVVYSEYMTTVAYNNLYQLIYNYLVNYVNENETKFANIDVDKLIDTIDNIAQAEDNNDTFDDMVKKLEKDLNTDDEE